MVTSGRKVAGGSHFPSQKNQTKTKQQLAVLDALALFHYLPDLDPTPGKLNRAMTPSAVEPIAPARVHTIDELAHTPNHLDGCPACKALNAALQVERKNISSLTFAEARLYWAARRVQATGIRSGTHDRDDAYMEALEHFFGAIRLRDISPGNLARRFQG